MNETETTALAAQVRTSKKYCIGKLPTCWNTHICWSNQLTSSIGNARKGSPNVIKLSVPIVQAVFADHGLESALQAVDETVQHEFAHVAVKFPDAPAHGQEWAANMHILGQAPERYHNYRAGRELFADGALMAKFTRGTEVVFQYKSVWYRGNVSSHKTRRVHARARTKLVAGQWEPLNRGQFTFTCPWGKAVSELLPVQDPKPAPTPVPAHTTGIALCPVCKSTKVQGAIDADGLFLRCAQCGHDLSK